MKTMKTAIKIALTMVLFSAVTCTARLAHAEVGYYVAWFGPKPEAAKGQPVHIVVAGQAEQLGNLLIQSAFAQALHWLDIEPEKPVMMIVYNELGSKVIEQRFKAWGIQNFALHDALITPDAIAGEAGIYSSIRSLEVYTHGTRSGIAILGEHGNESFMDGDDALNSFIGHFDAQAFARFYGCNIGYDLAPALANLWHIPVGGALTSTDLHYLHSTGYFYALNDDTKPPGPWATVNTLSFTGPRTCKSGGCIRMKPDLTPYNGVHGKYVSGLGFYKFFCGPLSENECAKRIAMTIPSWLGLKPLKPGDSKVAYKEALVDFICPIHHKLPLRDECSKKLAEIEVGNSLDYSPFLGPETSCDFKACAPPDPSLKGTSTFAREYQAYLKGLDLL